MNPYFTSLQTDNQQIKSELKSFYEQLPLIESQNPQIRNLRPPPQQIMPSIIPEPFPIMQLLPDEQTDRDSSTEEDERYTFQNISSLRGVENNVDHTCNMFFSVSRKKICKIWQ